MSQFVRCGADPGAELGGKGWHRFAIAHPPAGKRSAAASFYKAKAPLGAGLTIYVLNQLSDNSGVRRGTARLRKNDW